MRHSRTLRLSLPIALVLFASTAASFADPLPITPIRARASGWEAQAIGEMVFRYFGIPAWDGAREYQCGIAAAMMPAEAGSTCANFCRNCELGSGSPTELTTMIEHYPRRVNRQHGNPNASMSGHAESLALAPGALRAQLTRKFPVIALLGARLGTPRAVLLIGFRDERDDLYVLLLDPAFEPTDRFWTDAGSAAGPSPGAWWVPYQTLRGALEWDHTIMLGASAEGEVPIAPAGPRSGG